jgi:hypothetical protein
MIILQLEMIKILCNNTENKILILTHLLMYLFTEADEHQVQYDIYLQQVLRQQIDAGIQKKAEFRHGEVALPSMIYPIQQEQHLVLSCLTVMH